MWMTPYRMSTSFASVTSMVFTKNWPLKYYHLFNLARSLVELGTILCDSIWPLQKLAPKNLPLVKAEEVHSWADILWPHLDLSKNWPRKTVKPQLSTTSSSSIQRKNYSSIIVPCNYRQEQPLSKSWDGQPFIFHVFCVSSLLETSIWNKWLCQFLGVTYWGWG